MSLETKHEEITIDTSEIKEVDEAEKTAEVQAEVPEEKKTVEEPKGEDLSSLRQTPKADEGGKKASESVPLATHLELKKELKELKQEIKDLKGTNKQINADDLEALAAEYELDPQQLSAVVAAVEARTTKQFEQKLAPILQEKQAQENDARFNQLFEKEIASKYPELVAKKDTFKKIVFSPDFTHLKTFEDIRKEFFPAAKAAEPAEETVKDSVEAGSRAHVGGEKIDYSNMSDDQYAKVMANPKQRADYYSWRDAQGV